MKINLSNYSVNTDEVMSIYPPAKYQNAQKLSGCTVVPEYLTGYYKPYHISVKQTWARIYNNIDKIKYIIIYDEPNDIRLIQNIVHYAFKQGITVFYRQRSNCEAGLKPVYTELSGEKNVYHSRPGNQYDYLGSYYTETPEKHSFKVISDITKAKLKKYFTYYEITYPETEYDWYLAFKQIKYYYKNRIPFAFDKNKYHICPECKELILRGTEEEHICYCDIVPERTHMDYILNGEE